MDFRAGRLQDGSRDPSTFSELTGCVRCSFEFSTLDGAAVKMGVRMVLRPRRVFCCSASIVSCR